MQLGNKLKEDWNNTIGNIVTKCLVDRKKDPREVTSPTLELVLNISKS